MKPEHWQQIKTLLQAALEREPQERSAFLKEACADDPSLQSEVESLIASHEQAGGFIESPAFEVMAGSLADDKSMVGEVLGPYQIIGLLGTGGMGEVYLAEDTRLGRKVALKVLPLQFTRDDERVRRFQQEARAASALNHPNIITIYEIGQIGPRHFIATEFIQGETLRRHMARSQMKITEALQVAAKVASALCAAHDAGIVHRDIKPENIVLRTDRIVKVLDFGLVKLTEQKADISESPTLVKTAEGMVMATAHYMSPEQSRGLPVDARTDIWSLGVVLYEMVGGRLPFEGGTSSDVIASILNREPTTLVRYSPEVPTELEWIVKKALRKDKEERYQTARELLTDLKSLKRKLEFEQELARSMNSGPRSAEIGREPGYLSSEAEELIDSLAILPLTNNFADPGMEYFSDGITESMINALSQLPELRVMAWSTVSRYKGKEIDPRDAGRELGVRVVLTGRVRQLGERLIIKTELVKVADGSHLWGESFSCKPSDILDIEAEISRAISEKLLLRLTTAERKQLTRRYPDNVEAYHAYLKGRYFWNKRSEEGLKKGVAHFQQAIDEDPGYAAAYAGLSDCYTILVVRYGLPSEEGIPKAKAAAMKALEIDDTLAEAHTSLAHALLHNWEWDMAEREFKRAVELNPNDANAHNFYAEYLRAMGRVEQAISAQKRAQELDPLSLNFSTGAALYFARRYDQAIAQCQKTLEMDRNFFLAHYTIGQAYEQKGMFDEAITAIQRAVELSPDNIEMLAALGRVLAVAGRREEARQIVDQLEAGMEHRHSWQYDMALIYAGLGEDERAFECLEKGYQWRDGMMILLNVEPRFDSLRSDPRFTELVRRIGLPPIESIHPVTPSSKGQRTDPAKEPMTNLSKLAILPLTNASPDPSLEYLSDGITESIINSLSQLPKLRVMARSSVFRYKGKDVSPQQVGRELGVRAVLTGRVLQVGDRLVVGAELVDTTDETQLWGKHYNRNLSDIFEVQEEIAHEISEALRLRLTGTEQKRLAKRHTENTAAYQLHLKGRYYWNKRSEEALHKSIECFQQAIEIDPNYALAYAGLADCYTKLGDVGVTAMLPREAFTRARAAALRALEIDNSLAEAHASLGHIDMHHLRWADAEIDLKRALELNPNYATAHHWYAYYMAFHQRFDEALEKIEVALKLDPLSLPITDGVGEILYFARRNDEAIAQFRKALEMDPNFLASRINLGRAYEQAAMFSEAEDQFVKARQITSESIDALAALGHTYAMSANTGAALGVLAQLTELSKERYVSPYDIALIHTALGETDEAFRWLEMAYDQRVEWMIYSNVDPRLDPLRRDARFLDLMRRIGFAPTPSFHHGTLSAERQRTKEATARPAKMLNHAAPYKAWLSTREGKIFLALAVMTILASLGYLLLRRLPGTKETAAPRNFTFTQLTDQPGPEFFPSLSPDGKSLVYASRASGNWDIYLQRVGGRNSTDLTKDSQADDTQPAFSPDGERIAFRSEREGGGVYLMGATGEPVVRLSDFGYSPSWSPDGGQIVVGTEKIPQPSTRPSKSQLWTINVKTNERRLMSEGDALQPNYSPHEQRIAYWSRPSRAGQRESIWTIPADGGEAVAVTNGATTDLNPVWSPDGKRLYFSSNRGGSTNIWRVAIDEKSGVVLGQPEAVTTIGAATSALYLSLSGDGRRLAYVAQEEIRNLRKVSFDPSAGKTASEPVSVTRGSMQLWFPDASPDGEWLACYSMGNQRHILIMRTDGSGLRDLTDDSFRHYWPRWSPDGKRIAFSSRRSGNFELWVINRDGSGLQQLTQAQGAHYSPWSPDGRMIAYSIHTPKNDCVIVQPDKAWNEQKLEYLPPLSDSSLSFEGWSWSPDGKRLAGIKHLPSGVHSGIGVYDLESKNYTWFTDFGDWPRWLNDNRRLLFVSQGKMLLLDTRTRKYQPVLTVTDEDVDIGSPGLSPDNRTIYFTYVAAEADIWLMTLE